MAGLSFSRCETSHVLHAQSGEMAGLISCIWPGRRDAGGSTLSCLLLLLFFVIPTLLLPSPAVVVGSEAADAASHHDAPTAAERAMGIFSQGGPWQRIRSWVKLTLLNLRPPDALSSGTSASKLMEEAALRSLEAGKATAEEAAKTAAEVTDAAVEKTKEKIKNTLSPNSGREDTEL